MIKKKSALSFRLITMGVIIALLAVIMTGCGKSWVCDNCGTQFSGTAYCGHKLDSTLCKECAWKYWEPLPIENYKK